MARAPVIHVKCDRCKREELQPVGEEKKEPDFQASFDGKKLVYFDLCSKCRETVNNTWKELEEWDRQIVTTLWKGPSVPSDRAPPMNPAPDNSPPKPHSIAASNKR